MAQTMRNAFIRVTAENNTEENGIVFYSFEDIKNMVSSFAERYSGTKYCWICHNRDIDPVSKEPTKEHYHIVFFFKSPVKFKYIKECFPYGNIQNASSKNACIQYLLHLNDKDKTPYDKANLTTNINESQLDDLLTTTDGETQSRKMVDNIIRKIANGEIREYNRFDYIDPVTLARNKTLFANAFRNRSDSIMGDFNRKIDVIFIYGDSGSGKTTYAKMLSKNYGNGSYYISSSSNDTMQDYQGQDVLILDDLRDDAFNFADFLKVIDNNTATSIKSRFFNKTFLGKAIIVTSCVPYYEWYKDSKEDRNQFYRRISAYMIIEKKSISTYKFVFDDKTDKYSPVFCFKSNNPVTALFKAENDSKDDTIGSLLNFAKTLVSDIEFSEDFKKKVNEELKDKQVAFKLDL